VYGNITTGIRTIILRSKAFKNRFAYPVKIKRARIEIQPALNPISFEKPGVKNNMTVTGNYK
jgi:hypothetical protein